MERPLKRIKATYRRGIDRLSNLPDSVIYHILSLMDAKYAVQTSILSKEWKFHWAHVPTYTFYPTNSSGDIEFQRFIANVFNSRKHFNLSRPMFRVCGITMPNLVKIFYLYVLSCRDEELDVRDIIQIDDQMAVDRISSLPDHLIHNILSFMDTKYAVQTSALSKRWRNQWKNIHCLKFDRASFNTWYGFEKFVNSILAILEPICCLEKLQIIGGGKFREKLTKRVLDYAKYYKLAEVEIDAIPPSWVNNVDRVNDAFAFITLKTLQISAATLCPQYYVVKVPDLFVVDNLKFVNCTLLSRWKVFRLCITRLQSVTISNLKFCKGIELTSDLLHTFNWKGEHPCFLKFSRWIPFEVNIEISPPADFETEKWCVEMGDMVSQCCLASSINVLLNTRKVICSYICNI